MVRRTPGRSFTSSTDASVTQPLSSVSVVTSLAVSNGMCNGILGWLHTLPLLGWLPESLERVFGILFAPVAFILGVPWKDCGVIGDLLGTRLVLNEFVSFLKLGPLRSQLDPKSFTIATYALCGFANFSSIAIQIGGIGALAPTRKSDLARLGLRAVAAGTMSACIAGMLL